MNDMISMTTEQNYYLYPKPMDMRKGIDRLAEIVRTEMLHDPYITNGVYVFMSRDLRKIKVLSCYKISWSDFVLLTEGVQKRSVTFKNIS